MMTQNQWRELRNNLQLAACNVNIYSREYKNICRRIKWIHDYRLGYYLPF